MLVCLARQATTHRTNKERLSDSKNIKDKKEKATNTRMFFFASLCLGLIFQPHKSLGSCLS